MNDILKQRLVGALILVALGVIFWPIIFVQPGEKAIAEQQRIPPRPDVSTAAISPPDQVGLRASREMPEVDVAEIEPQASGEDAPAVSTWEIVSSAAQPEKVPAPVKKTAEPARTVREKAPAPLVMDSDGIPVAWILQVASVSSAEKASELRQRLSSLNYKADVKKVERGGKVFYRVYLGPKFERAKLEKLQASIDAEFRVKSMVARYIP